MIQSDLGTYEGKTLTFHQCVSVDEAQAAGLPTNCMWFWLWGDEKILTPGVVVQIMVRAAKSNQLPFLPKITDPNFMRSHFDRLRQAQVQAVQTQIRELQTTASNAGLPADAQAAMQQNLQTTLDALSDPVHFPDDHGLASLEQMEKLYAQHPVLSKLGKLDLRQVLSGL